MKKLILLLFIPLVFACSDDESSDNNENNNDTNLLVSKVTVQATSDDMDDLYEDIEVTYHYNGNKIVEEIIAKENGDYFKREFFYTDNKISLVNIFSDYEGGGYNLSSYLQFEYDSEGRVVLAERYGGENMGLSDFSTFSYNSNGSIDVIGYEKDTQNNDVFEIDYMSTFSTDDVGNIINIDNYYSYDLGIGELGCNWDRTYEFDNYNSPFKNIEGANGVLLIIFMEHIAEYGGCSPTFQYNNSTLGNREVECPDNSISGIELVWSYDYNDYGYPANVIESSNNVPRFIITFEYTE